MGRNQSVEQNWDQFIVDSGLYHRPLLSSFCEQTRLELHTSKTSTSPAAARWLLCKHVGVTHFSECSVGVLRGPERLSGYIRRQRIHHRQHMSILICRHIWPLHHVNDTQLWFLLCNQLQSRRSEMVWASDVGLKEDGFLPPKLDWN